MKQFFAAAFLLLFSITGCLEYSEEEEGGEFNTNRNTRGWRWVQTHPMFISALLPSMGPPPTNYVNNYFGRFQATAAHLWVDSLPDEVDGWMNAGRRDFRFVSHLQANGKSTANGRLMGGYPENSRGRIGFQFGDEPARGCPDYLCAMANLQRMQDGMRVVRRSDPNALLYVNFRMSGWVEDLLKYYCENMDGDIISHDFYSYSDSAYRALETFRRYGLTYGKPYWRYLRSYVSRGDSASTSESDMRWQAFSGLVYGYTGHSWFIYNIGHSSRHDPVAPLFFDRSGTFYAATTHRWQVAARINQELKNLGRAITQLVSTDVRYIRSNARILPPATRDWAPGAGGDAYITDIRPRDNNFLELSVGFFKDGKGDRYFMVQNVSRTGARRQLAEAGQEVVRISFDFSGAPDGLKRSRLLHLNKNNGRVENLPLTHRSGSKGHLDVSLNAGDPILLKYDNGRRFARR